MFEEFSLSTGRGRHRTSGFTTATVRCLGQDLQLEERVVCSVSFSPQPGKLAGIFVNGVNQMTGNGGYLIASKSGHDITQTNYFSHLGLNGRMASSQDANGPSYTLEFWRKTDTTWGFRARVTANDNYATVSLPFDFAKAATRFNFNGSEFWVNNQRRAGSGSDYAAIPQPHSGLDQNGNRFYVGVADTRRPTTWGEVVTNQATIRVSLVGTPERYAKMIFYHHSYTNNLELSFGSMQRNQTARVEGEIRVTERPAPTWTFQTESHNWHQTGIRDGNAHRVRAGIDPAQRFMSFGPYTTDITPGQRTATFRLMADNASGTNRVLTIDVFDASTGRVITSRDISRRDFGTAMQYRDFTLGFTASAGQRLEFRTYWHGGTSVWQDYVQVR